MLQIGAVVTPMIPCWKILLKKVTLEEKRGHKSCVNYYNLMANSMFKKSIKFIENFRNANKEPFNSFTVAWKDKSFDVAKEEKSNLIIWFIFGFLSVSIAIIFGNPQKLIPDAVSDAISLTLPGYLLFSGATVGLIPLLIHKDIVKRFIEVGNVLMKGALHGSSLLLGILMAFLIVGGMSKFEKPNGFFVIFTIGIVETAIMMAYAIFGLSFAEAYKTFSPRLGHKIWLLLLFLACLYSTHYIFKH